VPRLVYPQPDFLENIFHILLRISLRPAEPDEHWGHDSYQSCCGSRIAQLVEAEQPSKLGLVSFHLPVFGHS
jgi:hypothetical protein